MVVFERRIENNMENDLSNQNKRFYSDDYQELVNKLKCGTIIMNY